MTSLVTHINFLGWESQIHHLLYNDCYMICTKIQTVEKFKNFIKYATFTTNFTAQQNHTSQILLLLSVSFLFNQPFFTVTPGWAHVPNVNFWDNWNSFYRSATIPTVSECSRELIRLISTAENRPLLQILSWSTKWFRRSDSAPFFANTS